MSKLRNLLHKSIGNLFLVCLREILKQNFTLESFILASYFSKNILFFIKTKVLFQYFEWVFRFIFELFEKKEKKVILFVTFFLALRIGTYKAQVANTNVIPS